MSVIRSCSNGSVGQYSEVNFVQGQAGALTEDGPLGYQPRFVVPTGTSITLTNVHVTIGKPGTTNTTVQVSVSDDQGENTANPPVMMTTDSLVLGSGVSYRIFSDLIGTTLTSNQHVQTRVSGVGTGAESCFVHFFGTINRNG